MLLAYEIDAMGGDTYWEIFSATEKTYMRSVDSEDMGDFLDEMRNDPEIQGEVLLFPQPPYQEMYDMHIEMENFWGPRGLFDYAIDDCESIFDPQTEYNFECPGCRGFLGKSEGKTYADSVYV